jgi:glycogen operon protein
MISHGDEIGRTQQGNNNAYCQDNPLAWMDWTTLETNSAMLEFTRTVVAFRRKHPVFRRRRFLAGQPVRSSGQVRDIAWLTPAGEEMTLEDWDSGFGKSISVFLNGDAIPEPNARGERVTDDSFLLCFNAHDEALDFVVPGKDYGASWAAALDTADPHGHTELMAGAGETISLQARSLLVLRKTA